MRIGILGTGGMADALGAQWRRSGHEVLFGGRDLGRAETLARRWDGAWGTLHQAADFGTDAVLMALPWRVAIEVARQLPLTSRVLIDCTNPVGQGFRLLTVGGPSAAEQLATAAGPETHVVKAFNLCHEDVWRLTPPVFDGRPLGVPLSGDNEQALAVVRQLVRDVGCEPFTAGELGQGAALLEATAALFIRLWVGEGADAQSIAPPGESAGPLSAAAVLTPSS
ncbi:NADPH-dependent F420 reductase [Streptomyces sp. MBT53]|uniref:NADPH-dependent F420 reductase n=1 Tax=Streptomyces sp. MBT53 TaxID=1488384 RepID=UPI0019145D6B|nr:NAD(P)-binding domain-containing protein [Streptomyces sp. MBT53]MBK6019408.1 NAD(P)-binding domain-containing protein [Streptomyces sp. MBT53]